MIIWLTKHVQEMEIAELMICVRYLAVWRRAIRELLFLMNDYVF